MLESRSESTSALNRTSHGREFCALARLATVAVILSLVACAPQNSEEAARGHAARETGSTATSGGADRPLEPGTSFDLSAVMRQVHFAFRQEGQAWIGGHTTYATRVGAAETEIVPRHPLAGGSAKLPLRVVLAA